MSTNHGPFSNPQKGETDADKHIVSLTKRLRSYNSARYLRSCVHLSVLAPFSLHTFFFSSKELEKKHTGTGKQLIICWRER